MAPSERRAAVALGSNVGDRASHLSYAVAKLRRTLSDVVVSRFIETRPEHAVDEPLFLNAALVGGTSDTPDRLLAQLLAIERERGRVCGARVRGGARWGVARVRGAWAVGGAGRNRLF